MLSALSPNVRSAEDELLVAVEHGSVGDALRTLSPELRPVLLATVIDGLSTREAAHLIGIPQGTVKSRARIAKSRLREQLISGRHCHDLAHRCSRLGGVRHGTARAGR
jgi:DNA-directed RNA polymerase specialized sigma24 family protein